MLSYLTDVLITINREDYERARACFGMKRLEYVPGIGIDTAGFNSCMDEAMCISTRRELGIADDAMMVLMVGELSKRKNHISVLRAVAELKASESFTVQGKSRKLCICIAGTGVYSEYFEHFIQDKHLQNEVRLLGYREDMLKLYRAADAFLFPSYQEGLSAALMEAMACGLPAAASRIRGNTDLIDKEGGILFDVGREPRRIDDESESVHNIRKALEWLRNLSEEECKAMGEYNQAKIRENFDTAAVSQRLRQIYGAIDG